MKIGQLLTIGAVTILFITACSRPKPQATPPGLMAEEAKPKAVVTQAALAPTAVPTVVATKAPSTPTVALATQSGGSNVTEGDIKNMATAWSSATSYRIRMESTQAQSGEILMEVVRPDREHIKFTTSGMTIEVITIGTDTYSSLDGKKWTKSTSSTSSQIGMNIDPEKMVAEFNSGIASGGTATKGEKRVVNGATCQDWTISGATPSETATMCIGTSDNLPRELKSADGKVTMTFSDWNAPIAIDPPLM